MIADLLHALIATGRVAPTLAEVAASMGLPEEEVDAMGEAAHLAGLVEGWDSPDGFRVTLAPLAPPDSGSG